MLAVERVKFDMQRMENAEIAGIAYQRGSLYHYEVMEYLLEKHHRACAYCGITDVPFERDHIVPRSQGGSNRISNLVLSCRPCNQAKGAQSLEQFLIHHPAKLAAIKKQLKTPLHDAAAVNTTRNALFEALLQTRLPVATGSGAQIKLNRQCYNVDKEHCLDAACVGDITGYRNTIAYVIQIAYQGRGTYQRAISDAYGFPKAHRPKSKHVCGFQTGDLARITQRGTAHVLKRQVRVAVRSSGSFNYRDGNRYSTANWKNCHKLQCNDGYGYTHRWLQLTRPTIISCVGSAYG